MSLFRFYVLCDDEKKKKTSVLGNKMQIQLIYSRLVNCMDVHVEGIRVLNEK